MDAAPAAMGHALVIPKAHYDNALSAEPGVLGSAMEVAMTSGSSWMRLRRQWGMRL